MRRLKCSAKRWKHSGAVKAWKRNSAHIEQLYDYGQAVKQVMYASNAIEAINFSIKKVTKTGAFSNETALFKLLYIFMSQYEQFHDRLNKHLNK